MEKKTKVVKNEMPCKAVQMTLLSLENKKLNQEKHDLSILIAVIAEHAHKK